MIVDIDLPGNKSKRWFTEEGPWNEVHLFSVNEVIYKGKTAFQSILIVDTEEYGRMLAIDGATQSAEEDEYVYHEALVHPGMVAHPAPRRVLMIGGGEGATAREVLRHPSVERAVMVDIDQELVELCKVHLPTWHRGAFEDPRLEVVFADGEAYVKGCTETFDVIIIDVCDALGDTPALPLYTERFYTLLKKRLAADGVLVVQSMELSMGEADDHAEVRRKLKKVFKQVASYCCFVPSFWCDWGYLVASDTIDVAGLPSATIDARLAERGLAKPLRFYDGDTHTRIFCLPKDLRTELAERGA